MCRSDNEPDGPRSCSADTRQSFSATGHQMDELNREQILIDYQLHHGEDVLDGVVPQEYEPTPERRWRLIRTDDFGRSADAADRYATDTEMRAVMTLVEDAADWDDDPTTATGWSGCSVVLDGHYLTAVHVDRHPDFVADPHHSSSSPATTTQAGTCHHRR